MKIVTLRPKDRAFPEVLRQIPVPPEQIFWLGAEPVTILNRPTVAIVGSRKASDYGRTVTASLSEELARQGIVIVSGLALGIDSIAHQGALTAGGTTVAVLPAGLDKIYPASHSYLAAQIVKQGGALISEYPPGEAPGRQNFIARNRLIAGLANGLVITEAAINSGSLHTARFALEQGKTVMAVPGNITSALSVGTNNLLRAGATVVTSAQDVLEALGWPVSPKDSFLLSAKTAEEHVILDLLANGVSDGETILRASGLSADVYNQTLTALELGGQIRPTGANQWSLR